MKTKTVLTTFLALVCAISLSACGKRGGPFPPDKEAETFPRQYPKAETK